MYTQVNSRIKRLARVRRVRAKIVGTAERPRLVISRTLRSISGQLIDDSAGITLASASDRGLTGLPIEKAKQVGLHLAEAAATRKIVHVVFDRAGLRYHGRVAALAAGAREGGLQF